MWTNRITKTWLVLVVAVGLAGPMAGCSRNEATGQMQLNLLSEEAEIKIGLESKDEFIKQSGGQLPDEKINRYVSLIGEKLAIECERPSLPWEFTVLDSSVINAFALPGGKVFISRGLLEKMDNEAQLAGVLGHEIGHVTAKHANNRMTNALIAAGVVVAVGAATDNDWAPAIAGGVAGIGQLKFSRDEEIQSDTLGMRYMTRAGYDPAGQLQVMQILQDASEGPRPPEFLSTHPLPQTRIDRIEQELATTYAQTQNNPDYARNADRFKSIVLNRLSKLPPPKHDPANQQAALAEPRHHGSWCACGTH